MPPTPVRWSRRRRIGGLAAVVGVAALGATVAAAPTPSPSVTAAAPRARPVIAPAEAPASVDAPPLSEQLAVQAAAAEETREAPSPAPPAPAPEPTSAEPARTVWDRLADCESGEWTGEGGFVTDSANWSATAGTFEGGLQFHPGTWDGFRDANMPAAAYDASRAQQVAVAERVLDAQGWKAWPVCSRKLGLR